MTTAAAGPGTALWDCFVVIGLPQSLRTVQGEAGFLGSDHRYQPDVVDSLPFPLKEAARPPPPHVATCCLPGGVDIVLQQDLATAALTPRTFSVVLTEGNGTNVYASCLTFYDRVPHELSARHEDLLGAKSLKAICLLSHQPYLASSDKVLRELYRMAFVQGCTVPLPELISSLLAVPCAPPGGPKVCVRLGGSQVLLWPRMAVGPPPGELPLQPLVEALGPGSLVGLFAAVLLEQRVLLRSQHHWRLTVVAEGLLRLLHPLRYHYVYIPVLPEGLREFVQAPTPFLMGLHSGQELDPRDCEALVVADLDSGSLSLGRDDSLMKRSLNHPYMQQLQLRVRMLLQPSLTETDALGQSSDPWLHVAQQASAQPWGPCKQALLLQLFMEFFRCVLSDYQLFVSQQLAGRASSSSSITSGSQAGAGVLSLQHQHSGAMLAAALGGGTTGGGSVSGLTKMRSVGRLPRHQHSPSLDLKALLEHHHTHCRHSDSALLQQIVQGQLFLTFAAENSAADDPGGWLKTAQAALQASREAEESLQAATAAFPCDPAQFFGSSIEQVVIPSPLRPPGRLLPPGGLLYSCFPPLVLLEACGAGDGAASMRLRRRISTSGKKRPSAGKRRAISELMGSQVDLRRNSQTQASINTDSGPPRLRNQADAAAAAAGAATPPLPPGLSSLAKVSTNSNASTGSFCHDYSAEAGLVRRQTALLVQLMQPAQAPGATVGPDELSSSDLEAARLLLCVQTGGNGWFLVSRMKEIITAGSSHCSTSSSSTTTAVSGQATVSAAGASDAAALSIITAGPGQARPDSGTPAISAKSSTSSRAASTSRGPAAATAAVAAGPSGRVPPSGSVTSSIGRSQLPGALKMESMVNAASAMAIRITRTGSGAKQKQATSSSSSSGSSFTIQASPMGSSVTAAKPPSTAVQGLASVASADAPDAGDADSTGPQELLAVAGAGDSISSSLYSNSGRPSSCGQQAAPARSSLGNSKGRRSSNGAGGGGGSGGCWWEWRVSSGAFQVLGDMLSSILDVAAYAEDYRVVLAVLELASLVTCQPAPAGRRRSLLGCFAGSPAVAGEWLWAGAFGCAVTSLYLQAEELMNMKDVVTCCLGTFARYVTGVGISGPSAWLLLMQLAVEHTSRMGELEPGVLMELRALLAQQDSLGHQERLGQLPWAGTRPAAAGSTASSSSSSSAGCAAGQLPEHLLAALKACGLEHISDAAAAAAGATSRDAAMPAAAAGWRQQQRLMASCGFIGPDKLAVPLLAEEGEEGLDDEVAGQAGDGFAAAQSSLNRVLLCRHYSRSTSIGGGGSSSRSLLAAAPDRAEPLLATSLGLPCPNAAAAAAGHAAVIPAPGTASAAESTAASTIPSPRQAAAPGGSPSPAAASASGHSPQQLALAAVASSSKPGCSKPSPRSEGTSPRRESPRDSRPKLNRQHTGKGYSSIARQATADSAGCSRQPQTPGPAAAGARGCSTPAAADGSCARSAGSAADGAAAASAAVTAQGIQVASEGSSLAEPGALQWAAIHGRAVTAVAASNFVAVSVSLDGSLKVVNTAGSHLQLAASMSIPALQPAGATAAAGVAAVVAAVPVLKLWQDGSRAAVGNARQQAVWVLDLQGAAASVELSGLGSSVSALQLLHRNRETLLVGLARPSSSCHALSSCSGAAAAAAAAAYLWDLRRPRKPATSLDISLGAAAGTGGDAAGDAAAGPVGVLGLSVHEDGVLAAAGCRDGRGIVWDMRQPSMPLAVCAGHSGPVRQVRFLPAAAATPGSGVGVGSGRQQLLLTGSDDWTARLWDAGSGGCSGVCVGHGGPVTAVQVAHGRAGTRLVTGAADGSMGVWGLAGELCSLRQQHWAPVQLLAQGVDTLVSGAADKTCCVYSLPDVLSCHLERPPPLLACQPRRSLVTSMGHDPVAELLCAGHRDGLVSVWNCSFSADDQ